MSRLRVAPEELLRGAGAIATLAERLRSRGGRGDGRDGVRALLVHGEHGYAGVRQRVDDAFAAAGVRLVRFAHTGPGAQRAIDAIAAAADAASADWLVGVGGGRVLDATKGAAHALERRVALIPTSPATCAATAPTVVVYDDDGRHLDARELGPASALVALDADLLAAAPDRLLVAGIADAWAKVHEVTLTARRAAPSATTRAALALVEDLRTLLRASAAAAVAAGPSGANDPSQRATRALVAEAVVLAPGLIGGLAGRDAKRALAHPLHDALTTVPGSLRALHGEKVAFGTLVQLSLAGSGLHDASASECARAVADELAHYASLGLRCDLEALGCAAVRGSAGYAAIAEHALNDPSVLQALPDLRPEQLAAAIAAVDDLTRA